MPPVDPAGTLPAALLRGEIADFPEVSEVDVVRHFTRLSQWNYSVDEGLYPLGSCTMKYNPRINEEVARAAGLRRLHPLQPEEQVQGALRADVGARGGAGRDHRHGAVTLQPAAGAHGELTGMLMIRRRCSRRGATPRRTVLIPDSAHGTNPATRRLRRLSTSRRSPSNAATARSTSRRSRTR